MTIYFDISKTFFQQHEVHLLNKKFFPLINDKLSNNNLYFELGFIDEFSQFNYPSQFFFEKIKGLLNVNENNYFEEKSTITQGSQEELYTKLNTLNPCVVRISTKIKEIEDEEKRTIVHDLPFCQVQFTDSNLIETKKNIFRIILKMRKNNNTTSQFFEYKIHQICLLIFDFFNLKTI
jgi:hypothetical protein